MTLYRIKTFKDMYESVLRRAKIPTTDTASINTVKELINSKYQEVAAEKKWRWLREVRDVTVPVKYNTGTVTVTNGSRTVTGTNTVWTADFKGRYFYVDQESYEIIVVDTTAQTLLLSTTYQETTNASASYVIYKPEIGLFPDCVKIEEVWHDYWNKPLRAISPTKIRELYSKFQEEENKAVFYTRSGFKGYDNVPLGTMVLNYDFLGEGDSYNIRLFPGIADEDYVLHVAYSKRITPLENDADEPLIPEQNRIILVYGALADFFSIQRNEASFQLWTAKYEKELRELEGDMDDVDDQPRLVVPDQWRLPDTSHGVVDLGSYFDKYYSIFEDWV